ncbi:isoleucine-tRNA ligase, partial [Friedmanniomyces endolithicus]
LITHGFVLDAEGRKMSKSVGNVIAPEQIIDGSLLPPVKAKKRGGRKAAAAEETSEERPKYDSLGPDVLRLWVASSDYTKDVSIAVPLLQEVHNALAKYRVTFKWLLGVLADFHPDRVSDSANLTFADTAVLYRFAQVSQALEQAFDEYAFHKGVKELNAFVNVDLSAFYFETCKDNLYTGRNRDRQRIQMVLALLTRHILRLLGPVLPHLVQEVSTLMSPAMKHWMGDPLRTTWTGQSELLSAIKGHDAQHLDGALNELRAISAAVQKAQEEARRAGKVKSGLACKVEIHVPADADAHYHVLKWHRDGELADLLVVSEAEIVLASGGTGGTERTALAWRFEQHVELPAATGSRQLKVVVVRPEGDKCVRCWKYTAEEEGVPCQRCQDVLKEREHVAT